MFFNIFIMNICKLLVRVEPVIFKSHSQRAVWALELLPPQTRAKDSYLCKIPATLICFPAPDCATISVFFSISRAILTHFWHMRFMFLQWKDGWEAKTGQWNTDPRNRHSWTDSTFWSKRQKSLETTECEFILNEKGSKLAKKDLNKNLRELCSLGQLG